MFYFSSRHWVLQVFHFLCIQVGGLDLFEKHAQLKEESKKSKDLERELAVVSESLKKEEGINGRLEGQVKNYREKKNEEEGILWVKRKRAYLVDIFKNQKVNYLKRTMFEWRGYLMNC